MFEPQIICRSHAVAAEALAVMRHKDTPPGEFSRELHRFSQVIAGIATRDLPQRPIQIETPLAPCHSKILAGRQALVPIMRSGYGMFRAFQDLLPRSVYWNVTVARDERTAKPIFKDSKVPGRVDGIETVFVLDPMLATAGSACFTIQHLKQHGAKRIVFVGLIACTEGLARLQSEHPDVQIYLGEVDPILDERKYIVPGLGDAGDRQFPTVPWEEASLYDRLLFFVE